MNRQKDAWHVVYQHARQGEILCAHHWFELKQIQQALIACVKAGVLTPGEVIRARKHWNKPAN